MIRRNLRRMRDFALDEPNLRLGGILVGVALLVAGVVTAVRAQASTTLLVLGAVVFLAVLFSADWREIILKHGESEARIRHEERAKGRAEVVEPTRAALEELADTPGDDVQPRIRQLNERLSDSWAANNWTIDNSNAISATALNTPYAYPLNSAEGFLGFGQYVTASNEVRFDKVYLRLHPEGFTPTIVVCDVTNENGATWTSGDRAWLLHATTPKTAELVLPDDFAGALLRPGRYEVRWWAIYPAMTALTYDAADSSTSTATEMRSGVVTTDSFVIEERETPTKD